MDRLAERAQKHPWWSLAALAAFIPHTVGLIVFTQWPWALVGIIVFYAVFTFVIYCTSRPRGWEGSILFGAFIMAAVVFILLFGGTYQIGELIAFEECRTLAGGAQECVANTKPWDWYYYSTVVFTTLGFGDVTPKLFPGKVVTAVEALLGMAYGVTAVIVFLGRHLWPNEQGSAEDKPAAEAANTCGPVDQQLITLLGAVTAQNHDLAKLRAHFAAHVMDTAIKLKHLKYALWMTWALLALLMIIFVGLQFH